MDWTSSIVVKLHLFFRNVIKNGTNLSPYSTPMIECIKGILSTRLYHCVNVSTGPSSW